MGGSVGLPSPVRLLWAIGTKNAYLVWFFFGLLVRNQLQNSTISRLFLLSHAARRMHAKLQPTVDRTTVTPGTVTIPSVDGAV